MAIEKYTDDTILDFGMHKGKKLINVPDSYLLFLYNEGRAFGKLKAYIQDNLDSIKENCKKQ